MGFTGELRFWTQIMGDHARFIQNSLAPDQADLKMIADNFIQIFDRFYERVNHMDENKGAGSMISDINAAVLSFREFKRELLGVRLRNQPVTCLGPTFYNHMLNELEDFLKVLAGYQSGKPYEESILRRHLLWTLDAAAHAAILDGDLDKVEYHFHDIAREYEREFDHLYLKIVELTGYFRSAPVGPNPISPAQPALEKYNLEAAACLQRFMGFLLELRQGVIQQQVMGRLLPLGPDHMWREECYYLTKIAECTPGFPKPECDPGRPRVVG